jgi:hypothetical protein
MTGPPTPAPTTVACDTGRHRRCRGVVVSVTDAHGAACACACHDGAAQLGDLAACCWTLACAATVAAAAPAFGV